VKVHDKEFPKAKIAGEQVKMEVESVAPELEKFVVTEDKDSRKENEPPK